MREGWRDRPRKAFLRLSQGVEHNRYTCPGGSALRHVIHGGPDTFFTPATALLEILMGRRRKKRRGRRRGGSREERKSDTRPRGDAPRIGPKYTDRGRLLPPDRSLRCLRLSLRQSEIHRRPDVMTSLSRSGAKPVLGLFPRGG